MLGHIGIIGLFDELGSGSLADGAEIGDGALSNVAADSANILFHKKYLRIKIMVCSWFLVL